MKTAAMDTTVSNLRKVQILYYLSRGGQLDHPHLLELSLSSTDGLYLRDVKKRLTMIRGKGLPTSFSWSYKRSYKNCYVWQDLCDDDLIFPAHGCEYVLMGSEILDTDKCNYTTKANGIDGKNEQEFQKSHRQEAITCIQTSEAFKHLMLEKSTEVASREHGAEVAISDSRRSHATVDFSQLNDDGSKRTDPLKRRDDPSQRCAEKAKTNYKLSWNTRKLHEFKVHSKQTSTVMVDNGTDAATQTEEEEKREGAKASVDRKAFPLPERKKDAQLKPNELHKDEVSPPPSSSNSSPNTTTAAASPLHSHRQAQSQSLGRRAQDDTLDRSILPKPPGAKKLAKSHGFKLSQREGLFFRSKTRQSTASGLLQFVSCGGLDVKEEIIPTSLYSKAKDPRRLNEEEFFELLRPNQGRSWIRPAKKGVSNSKCSCDTLAQGVGGNPSCQGADNAGYAGSFRADHRDEDLPREAALPDVISIARTSVSDRSSELCGELDFHFTESQIAKSGMERKSSPPFVEDKSTKRSIDLAIPSENDQIKFFQELRGTSSKLSEKVEGDCDKQTKTGNSGDKGYKSMALLWEELLAPKRDFKNRDERLLPPENSKSEWERKLQNAVELSLPPPDFYQLLQECLHCGRKFRPESLKIHSRSCSIQKSCKNSNSGAGLQFPARPAAGIQSRITKATPLDQIASGV